MSSIAPDDRYERERAEDQANWEHYVLTGNAVAHEDVAAWLEKLADGREAPSPR